MSKSYSVTSAGVSAAEDRAHRERMYYISMSLRVLCVVSLFWVRGWGVFVALAGAVILPWFAVMVGNAVASGSGARPSAPQPAALEAAEQDAEAAPESEVIVIDVDPERRSTKGPADSRRDGDTE